MSYYFIVMLASLAGPFGLSFDKKVHFYTYWKLLIPSILAVAIPFILWDEWYTQNGVWGFNAEHLQGIFIGSLPLEEICFFIFVPYACVFVHECIRGYFPNVKTELLGKYFAFSFTLLALVLGTTFLNNWYTGAACILAAILTIGVYFVAKVKWYGNFILTYLVVQIPFFVVNGALTGLFTENPIVWYSESEIIGPRWGTIPIEDTFYNYSMLLLVFMIYNALKSKKGLKV